jgi:hypothetical protein
MCVHVFRTRFVPNISCSDQYAASIVELGTEVLVNIFRSKEKFQRLMEPHSADIKLFDAYEVRRS